MTISNGYFMSAAEELPRVTHEIPKEKLTFPEVSCIVGGRKIRYKDFMYLFNNHGAPAFCGIVEPRDTTVKKYSV